MQFSLEEISDDEYDRRRRLYGPLAQSVRELVDAVIRTEADDETVRSATQQIDAVVADLRARQIDGAFGVRHTPSMRGMPWGNAVIGLRNAIAVPLRIRSDGAGGVGAEFTLGAAYEGPPGLVHGGVCAMLLDQVLGEAASVDGLPCFTGTISVRYLRPTPLGPLRITGVITDRDGRKKIVRGAIHDSEGETVTAEGVFIAPRNPVSEVADMAAERHG